MIYLDYAANTPVDERVYDCFLKINKQFIANPNSSHRLGREAKEKMDEVTEELATLLQVKKSEIIYTSGASEANNLAIKGLVNSYRENGKHIISTALEHSSVSGALTYLQTLGYEIDLLDINADGTIDLNHLKELMREDTVLVSVNAVDSELGVVQPVKEIYQMVKQYPNCFFHTDATQAVGRIPFSFSDADLITFAPHKFYGLNGSGVLVKKDGVVLQPIIHGGASTTIYRSGTPVLSMAAATLESVKISFEEMEKRLEIVTELNHMIQSFLKTHKLVRINSTACSLPYILNVSVKGVKAATFQKALEENDVFVSTKSACSVLNTPSRAVYAVSKDRKNAMCSWRISLSHLTTKEQLQQFFERFEVCYQQLTTN